MPEKVSTVRCLTCRNRFDVKLNTKKMKCPHCGKEYNISWPWPGEARIESVA
ncbi:hypothetical protein ACFLU1_05130 [Chloroflexota bacterium]